MPTILIAEDDFSTQELYATILATLPVQLVQTYDGFETLEYLQQTSPDMLLLDLRLPNIDGKQILEAIQHDPRHANLQIIIITATHPDRSMLSYHLLSKPINPTKLLQTVRTHLEAKAS